jgi:uncharacterized membrane protein (UPF0127 family)
MNNQLKLLLYIVFLAGVFVYIQDSFGIFNVSFDQDGQSKQEEVTENGEDFDEDIVVVDEKNYVEIFIGEGETITVNVEVADTEIKRATGLSNRRYLGDYDGMLFIFDEKVNRPFWMKDMLISIDIIFIDESGFIVDIAQENEPCTEYYCPQIMSSKMYKYVLEVNEGFCKSNGVEVGQSVVMHLASSR